MVQYNSELKLLLSVLILAESLRFGGSETWVRILAPLLTSQLDLGYSLNLNLLNGTVQILPRRLVRITRTKVRACYSTVNSVTDFFLRWVLCIEIVAKPVSEVQCFTEKYHSSWKEQELQNEMNCGLATTLWKIRARPNKRVRQCAHAFVHAFSPPLFKHADHLYVFTYTPVHHQSLGDWSSWIFM